MEQVLINLSSNAKDAIQASRHHSGKIEITTRKKSGWIEIIFKDNGLGMDQKTQSKIFNPFFTTKEVGKGMGLGLSLSYGILQKFHASISVKSELGKGTEFCIRVPIDFREISV